MKKQTNTLILCKFGNRLVCVWSLHVYLDFFLRYSNIDSLTLSEPVQRRINMENVLRMVFFFNFPVNVTNNAQHDYFMSHFLLPSFYRKYLRQCILFRMNILKLKWWLSVYVGLCCVNLWPTENWYKIKKQCNSVEWNPGIKWKIERE